MTKQKLQMISLLLSSTVVVSWGIMNINIPAMANVFYDVPLAMVENLATVSSLFIMIAVLLSHRIARTLGYKQTIVTGLSLVVVSGLVPLLVDNFYVIFISRATLGFGIGMFQALLVSLNKYFYAGETRTRMFGYQSAFEGLGGVTLTFIAGQLVRLGWQGIFWIYLLVIPVIILFILFVPAVATDDIVAKSKQEAAKSGSNSGTNKSVFNDLLPAAKYIVLVFVLAIMYMILGIKATDLILEKGIGSATDGATVLLLVGVGAMSSGFVFGRLTRITNNLTLPLGYLTMAVAMFLVGSAGNIMVMSLGGLLAGFSFRTIFPYLLNHVNSGKFQNSGLITSLLLVALNLGTFASPYGAMILSRIAGSDMIVAIFYLIAGILVVMAGGSLLGNRIVRLAKEKVGQREAKSNISKHEAGEF